MGVRGRVAAGAGGAGGGRGGVHVRGDVTGWQPHSARDPLRHRASLLTVQRPGGPARESPASCQRVMDARLRRKLTHTEVHRAETRRTRIWYETYLYLLVYRLYIVE